MERDNKKLIENLEKVLKRIVAPLRLIPPEIVLKLIYEKDFQVKEIDADKKSE